jgi:serine/threonine protein kinase
MLLTSQENNDNLIKVRKVLTLKYSKKMCAEIEYFPEGSLYSLIKGKNQKIKCGMIRPLIIRFQLLSAFACLQSANLSHPSINPPNILCTDQGKRLPVADRGNTKRGKNEYLKERQ